MPPSSRTAVGRAALVLGGTAIASYGYLMTVAAELGNGPLFAVQDALHRRLGLSLGPVATIVGLALVAVAALLRAPLGIGTVAVPIASGVWISWFETYTFAAHGTAARWIEFVAGTAIMMLGAVLALGASLGASAMDGVMLGLAGRWGWQPARARVVMELSLAAAGAALGGRVGPGTVVMGAMVGPLFGFWHRGLERFGLPLVAPGRREVIDTARDRTPLTR